mgnify:FL=1
MEPVTVFVEDVHLGDFLITHEGGSVYEMKVLNVRIHHVMRTVFVSLLYPDGDGKFEISFPVGCRVDVLRKGNAYAL